LGLNKEENADILQIEGAEKRQKKGSKSQKQHKQAAFSSKCLNYRDLHKSIIRKISKFSA